MGTHSGEAPSPHLPRQHRQFCLFLCKQAASQQQASDCKDYPHVRHVGRAQNEIPKERSPRRSLRIKADNADPLAEIFPSSWVTLVQDPRSRSRLPCHAFTLYLLACRVVDVHRTVHSARPQTPPSTGWTRTAGTAGFARSGSCLTADNGHDSGVKLNSPDAGPDGRQELPFFPGFRRPKTPGSPPELSGADNEDVCKIAHGAVSHLDQFPGGLRLRVVSRRRISLGQVRKRCELRLFWLKRPGWTTPQVSTWERRDQCLRLCSASREWLPVSRGGAGNPGCPLSKVNFPATAGTAAVPHSLKS
jgi:hypothetical protein